MNSVTHKSFSLTRRYMIGGVLLAFITLSLFGLVMMIDDHGGVMGMMPHCPFMPGMQSLCQMTIIDHVAAWQQIFSGIPRWTLSFILIVLATVTVLMTVPLLRVIRQPGKWQQYFHWQFVMQPSWILKQSLADGIIQPRLYN